jgi:hypothetical protein
MWQLCRWRSQLCCRRWIRCYTSLGSPTAKTQTRWMTVRLQGMAWSSNSAWHGTSRTICGTPPSEWLTGLDKASSFEPFLSETWWITFKLWIVLTVVSTLVPMNNSWSLASGLSSLCTPLDTRCRCSSMGGHMVLITSLSSSISLPIRSVRGLYWENVYIVGSVYGGYDNPKLTFNGHVKMWQGSNKISILSSAVGLPVSWLITGQFINIIKNHLTL